MLLQTAQASAISNALNNSEWIFPITECFHIAAFAWSIGLIALVDFSLIGIGIRHLKPSAIGRATDLWTVLGFAVVLFSGPVLFLSDPRMYFYNPPFRFKMGALALALIFNYTIHRKVVFSDGSSAGARLGVGIVSLLLWTAVVFGGLFIAFV